MVLRRSCRKMGRREISPELKRWTGRSRKRARERERDT